MRILEEHISTPVCGEYDVIVAGGGVAGAAAAVAAARLGKKVLLLEKSVMLGGLATLGLISYYEPISDGSGKYVMRSLPEELLRLSVQYSSNDLHPDWEQGRPTAQRRYAARFSPTIYAMALDRLVLDSKVELLFDTLCVSARMDGDRMEAVLVETKDGRRAYLAKAFVDATGDADLFKYCGLPTRLGGNYLSYVAHRVTLEDCREAAEKGDIFKIRKWISMGSTLSGTGHPEGYPYLKGVTPEDVTRFVLDGRAMLFEKIKDEPRSSRDLLTLPGMAQFRTTRRVIGESTLCEADAWKKCDTSVGILCDFVKADVCYEMPYGALYTEKARNLFAAGRIVSAAGWCWDAARVIPGAVLTGEAAGIAAALSCRSVQLSPGELYPELAEILRGNGVEMHL